MQQKWKEWEHSAVKMATPCPLLKLPKQMGQVFLDDLEVWKLRLRERPREDEPEECERSEQDGRGQFEPDGRGQLVPA